MNGKSYWRWFKLFDGNTEQIELSSGFENRIIK